jgi:hypothetical protein
MDIILDTGVLVQPQLGSIAESVIYSENYIERVVYKAGYGNPIIRVEDGKDVLLTCYSTEDTTTTNNIQLRKLLLPDGRLKDLSTVLYKALVPNIAFGVSNPLLVLQDMGIYELSIVDKTADIIITAVIQDKVA